MKPAKPNKPTRKDLERQVASKLGDTVQVPKELV